MLMIYFGIMKMTSPPKWRHFPFFVYIFTFTVHLLFIFWCNQCLQYIKASSFSHKNYDFLEMSLLNSLQFKKLYDTKCVSIILYIYITSTPMYWSYAKKNLWMERKRGKDNWPNWALRAKDHMLNMIKWRND
jgi:hypothetical protein